MIRTWQVGLLSLVPGIGLLALGETAWGLGVFIGFVALVFVYLLAPWQIVYELSCGSAIVLWASQLTIAIAHARRREARQARLDAGQVNPARPPVVASKPPAGASRSEKLIHRAREALSQQLFPGEHLKVGITCQAMPTLASQFLMGAAAFATMRQFHIGATECDLVLVELDLMGRPSEVRRQPLAAVKVVESKDGLLVDTLVLDVGEPKTLRLQIPRLVREATHELLRTLPH